MRLIHFQTLQLPGKLALPVSLSLLLVLTTNSCFSRLQAIAAKPTHQGTPKPLQLPLATIYSFSNSSKGGDLKDSNHDFYPFGETRSLIINTQLETRSIAQVELASEPSNSLPATQLGFR
ncbi:MAG TPA: hypothetical protein V6D03_10025, partial [Candidatus Caenarcaniphilales bacterium]